MNNYMVDYKKALTQKLAKNLAEYIQELVQKGEKIDFSKAADLGIDGVAEIISDAIEKNGGPVHLDWYGRENG